MKNGWTAAQQYLAVILAALTILMMMAGTVYAWSELRSTLQDVSARTVTLETKQEQQERHIIRLERKMDRLLIEMGIDPDDVI